MERLRKRDRLKNFTSDISKFLQLSTGSGEGEGMSSQVDPVPVAATVTTMEQENFDDQTDAAVVETHSEKESDGEEEIPESTGQT